MTLEDFFTLTEMKDGLTVIARVEELVTVMQKEKDCAVKNISEAARQWSTVASTLAVSENKDCLDHFIRLDGLSFLDRWLQEAQKSSNDTGDSSVEESVTALLGALDTLPINKERSISSGIGVTVKNLFGHKSFRVQDRARALFDNWNQRDDNDADHGEKGGAFSNDEVTASAKVAVESACPEHSAVDILPSKESSNADNCAVEPAGSEILQSSSSDGSQPERSTNVNIPTSNIQDTSRTTLSRTNEDGFQETLCSIMSKPGEERLSGKEEFSIRPAGANSTETCCSPVPMKGNVEGKPLDVLKLKEITDDAKETDTVKSCPAKFGIMEVSSVSTILESECVSATADPANARESAVSSVDAKESNFCLRKTSPLDLDSDVSTLALKPRSGVSNHSRSTVKFNATGQGCDTLEVARQVAKEVVQEVIDYGESFCRSSSNSEGGVGQPGSPDSMNGEQDQPIMGLNEVPTGRNLSGGASYPNEKEHLISSKNMDTKPEDCMLEESSQVTEAAQESASNAEKGLCHFDLNEEIHSEEMDCPMTPISAPISVVAASRAAAAPGLPVAPLQFEGALGWKGSAETSAFRPASTRRIPNGDKTLFIEGSSYSSKQRQDISNIDLNLAGGDDNGVADPILAKQIPASSGLPSGESSIEVSSRRAEKLKLDLNCVDENDNAPLLGLKMEGRSLYHHCNGGRSSSTASSSSSRQPSMRSIDLNDNPSIFSESYDQLPDLVKSSTREMNAYGGFKLDDPVISIMGTRVEISQKEFVPHTRSFLPSGEVMETALGSNLAKTGGGVHVQPAMAYSSLPHLLFGYNMGPSISLSPAVYGPGSMPYIVDSRGGPVIPQILDSAAAVASSYPQPPYLMSFTGPPSGLNGIGLTRPNLDLNSGSMMVEGGSRESGGLRQLFVPGQGGLMEEHMGSALQPLSLGMGMKRKEPDGGWEQYPVKFRP
ncbi:hypothetical protein HHK36_002951 [Tetracentron sinense]|uniref:TFIIS N-terminal domain-containing protein n=1 Tax=Tetracentron sinense TaxID=13715 RepID=A0A834ZXF6_TETSI|nr:hypothetical protein HHK36_002951 [Tetracentron sinense]